jgi:hypothetical protein
VENARTRVCRAVPFDELFDQMEHRLRERRSRAASELRRLKTSDNDDRVYELGNVDQVYAKCRAILQSSEKIVVADLFPTPLEVLREPIREAAARIPTCLVQVYRPEDLPGVNVVLHREGETVLGRWPVQWIALMGDGTQSLLAAIEPEENLVHQAIWTASPVLSYALLTYAIAELELASLIGTIENGRTLDDVKKAVRTRPGITGSCDMHALMGDVPGYRALKERFAAVPTAEDESGPRKGKNDV